MALLPYLDVEQLAPEHRDLLSRNINLSRLMVNSPGMARALLGLGSYIRHQSLLDPRLRELAILQVGWMTCSEYEFTHHVKIGRDVGVTNDDIHGMIAETAGQTSSLDSLTRAVLRGTREMVNDLAMKETTFTEIRTVLSTEHMTDLVGTIAFYCAVVRLLATMRVDNEPQYKVVLDEFPMPSAKSN
jgi:alkylhydroperoxidase family enzyme